MLDLALTGLLLPAMVLACQLADRLGNVRRRGAESLRPRPLDPQMLHQQGNEGLRPGKSVFRDEAAGLVKLVRLGAMPLIGRPESVEVGDECPLGRLQVPKFLHLHTVFELLIGEGKENAAAISGGRQPVAAVEEELAGRVLCIRPLDVSQNASVRQKFQRSLQLHPLSRQRRGR